MKLSRNDPQWQAAQEAQRPQEDAPHIKAREKIERVLGTLMDDGYHFPNEQLILLDEAVVLLGGTSVQRWNNVD